MSDALYAAIIAGSAAVVVALVTQFAAEAFRRHRDGSAIAAALAGELGSYRQAMEILAGQVDGWVQAVSRGDRDMLTFRPIDRQKDLIFDEIVGKVGLLGAELTEKVVTVYGNIRAFRIGHDLIVRDHSSMDDDELLYRMRSIAEVLIKAREVGEPLVAALQDRAQKRFLARQ